MKKPVIIYAEGAGPFNSRVGRIVSKLFFNHCAYISVRDEISLKHLVNLGIERKRINLVADSAFLLPPSVKDFNYRKKGKKLIGVAVSKLAAEYGFRHKKEKDLYKSFINFISELIDWMIENLNVNVIMIPHVIQINRNDYQTASDVLEKVKNKGQIEILSKNLEAAELKKAISYCDLMIASRMHAAIAALSTYVPVIEIAYSHKARGIYSDLGIADLVIDIKDLDWGITNKIKEVLANSDIIKDKLKTKVPSIKKLAEKPSLEVVRILNK